jgi:ABC-type sulfate transport system permease subunit
MLGTFAGAWIIIVLVGLVIAALWIALPFAVFGIKPLIRQLIEEQRETRIAIVANTRASEASIARVAANPIVAAQPVVGGS